MVTAGRLAVTFRPPWWSLLVAALAGFLLCYWWPAPAPAAPVTLVVSDTAYLAVVPDTVIRWTERIAWRTVPAETIQVTRTRFDTVRVAAFCAAARDSSAAPILPTFAGRYDGRHLELSATRSDGTGWRQVQDVLPPFTWSARSSDVLVQGRRHLPRPVVVGLKLLGCGVLGVGVDRVSGDPLLGAAAGGGCVVGSVTPP